MMLNIENVTAWTAPQLYEQYKLREKLVSEMVGWLYPSILRSEMDKIEERAIKRFGYHPNWFPEKGLTTVTERNVQKEDA